MQALELLINIFSWMAIISGSVFIITGAYGASGSAGDGFRLNSTDLYYAEQCYMLNLGL